MDCQSLPLQHPLIIIHRLDIPLPSPSPRPCPGGPDPSIIKEYVIWQKNNNASSLKFATYHSYTGWVSTSFNNEITLQHSTHSPNECVLLFGVTQYNNVLLKSSIFAKESSLSCSHTIEHKNNFA